jgi:hypothetical protein
MMSQIISHLTQNHANSTEILPSDGPSNQLSLTDNLTAQKSADSNKNTPTASMCQTQKPSHSKKVIKQKQQNNSNKSCTTVYPHQGSNKPPMRGQPLHIMRQKIPRRATKTTND